MFLDDSIFLLFLFCLSVCVCDCFRLGTKYIQVAFLKHLVEPLFFKPTKLRQIWSFSIQGLTEIYENLDDELEGVS